jgi:hypothetical protein
MFSNWALTFRLLVGLAEELPSMSNSKLWRTRFEKNKCKKAFQRKKKYGKLVELLNLQGKPICINRRYCLLLLPKL